MKSLGIIMDWSEVWAPLIPLLYFLFNRQQPRYLKPVIVYLFIALFINLVGDIIGDFKARLPQWMQSNNPLYNIHSIIRFICFIYFFKGLGHTDFMKIRNILLVLSTGGIIINFLFVEDFFNPDHFSSILLSAEAYILLIFCLLYYLSKLRSAERNITSGPDFWVVTGLSIYVVVNFIVFLFYVPMIKQDPSLAEAIWNIHNMAYIILCIFITKALYVSARHQHAN